MIIGSFTEICIPKKEYFNLIFVSLLPRNRKYRSMIIGSFTEIRIPKKKSSTSYLSASINNHWQSSEICIPKKEHVNFIFISLLSMNRKYLSMIIVSLVIFVFLKRNMLTSYLSVSFL